MLNVEANLILSLSNSTSKSFKREVNTTDDSIIGLLNKTNEEVINENSNKNGILASTQRDLIAGEVSKDISRRKIIPAHIAHAHDEGVLHYHDMEKHHTHLKSINQTFVDTDTADVLYK